VSEPGLYILMISVHGLMRAGEMELGRDPDTGGQIRYVLELARALSELDEVERIDVLTRRVHDSKVASDYAQPEEPITAKATIRRLECGPRRYLRKEVLWPHLDSFLDRSLLHLRGLRRVPDLIHAHYADAAYVGTQLAGLLGVPFVFTGHSLGRVKRRRLLARGLTPESIEKRYRIAQRIEAEEVALDNAALVVASSSQEVEEQYALYDHYSQREMLVLPPGVDLSRFRPPGRRRHPYRIVGELSRFLLDPKRPLVLALSRADPRKNLGLLLHAFGASKRLRAQANLALVTGQRDDLQEMEAGARGVVEEIIALVDYYDLYGLAAYPKNQVPDDVPALYRFATRSRGVFVNPALTEPFGLTLLEAAASGLPVVATSDGGPQEIIDRCDNGLLVDALDPAAIEAGIFDALSDASRWRRWSKSGLRNVHRHYSWHSHATQYLRALRRLTRRRSAVPAKTRLPTARRLLVSDIDGTLLGDRRALARLLALLKENEQRVALAVATGRRIESARKVLKENGVPTPDVFITAVGTEIHYGARLAPDAAWARALDYAWRPDEIRRVLRDLPGLRSQPQREQRRYKISYDVDPRRAPAVSEIHRLLRRESLKANVIYSHGAYLDVLPVRASKGQALRFIALRWGMSMDRVLVAGDSGNDAEMLRGDSLGVVVGNHSSELRALAGEPGVYFAKGECAQGILEAIDHYSFLEMAPRPDATRPVPALSSKR